MISSRGFAFFSLSVMTVRRGERTFLCQAALPGPGLRSCVLLYMSCHLHASLKATTPGSATKSAQTTKPHKLSREESEGLNCEAREFGRAALVCSLGLRLTQAQVLPVRGLSTCTRNTSIGMCCLQSEMFAVWAICRQQGLLSPSVFIVLMGCPLCSATHLPTCLMDSSRAYYLILSGRVCQVVCQHYLMRIEVNKIKNSQ